MTSLDALSTSYGIEESSLNAGEEIVRTPAVKLAMLSAMGVETHDEGAAIASLKALEDSQ